MGSTEYRVQKKELKNWKTEQKKSHNLNKRNKIDWKKINRTSGFSLMTIKEKNT